MKIGTGIYFALNFKNEKNCYINIRLRDPNEFAIKEKREECANKLKMKLEESKIELKEKYPIKNFVVCANGLKANETTSLIRIGLKDNASLNNSKFNDLINAMYDILRD